MAWIDKINLNNEHLHNVLAGTTLTILGTWTIDIVHTITLAVIGATASYITSLTLKWIKNKYFK